MIIRNPRLDELADLSDLCFRSKAVWGYDEAFMNACRGELSIGPRDLTTTHVGVAEADGSVVGVAQLRFGVGDAELLKLFVEPDGLQKGTGRALFAWAVDVARNGGAHRMTIEADPGAVPFYRRMGARDAGFVPSGSIPGRMLPKLVLDVSTTEGRPETPARQKR